MFRAWRRGRRQNRVSPFVDDDGQWQGRRVFVPPWVGWVVLAAVAVGVWCGRWMVRQVEAAVAIAAG